ncbi:MAG: DNA-binding protein [Bacteroidetes bacterium]|nr:DNA-binding protein [Bacteroidota bacterium]
MSIPYKVVQRGQPGVAGGGVKKLYAAVVTTGETTVDELTKEIEKFSALSEADIRGVIIALENVMQNELASMTGQPCDGIKKTSMPLDEKNGIK